MSDDRRRPPGPRPPPGRRHGGKGGFAGRAPAAAGWVVGTHAAIAILRYQPERVLAVHCWSRDRELLETLTARCPRALERSAPPGLSEDHLAQGVAVRVRPLAPLDLDDLQARVPAVPGRLLLALDSITDTRNLGAILRAAAFFAVDGVLLPSDRAAGVNEVTERIARGGASVVPIAEVTNLARSLDVLRQAGWWTVGTALEPDAKPLWGLDRDRPLVLVLGAEDRGLRPLVRRYCDEVVRLDASGAMQSLNVASFAAVALAVLRRP